MEIAARFDESDFGDQRVGVDQGFEGHEADIELAADGDHDTVELLLDQCSVSTHTDLRAEHDVEGSRNTASGLVSHLKAIDLASFPGLGFVGLGKILRDRFSDIDARDRHVTVIIPRDPLDVGHR